MKIFVYSLEQSKDALRLYGFLISYFGFIKIHKTEVVWGEAQGL